MEAIVKRNIGRSSKGPRHKFDVKLDLERTAKLKELLKILNIDGIGHLTPIIEAHLDSIDLDQLRDQPLEGPMVVSKDSTTPTLRRNVTPVEALRRAETLAWKINLLLDIRRDDSGLPYDYQAVYDGAIKAGFSVNRTKWTMLKNGKVQALPDAFLPAIATVFDVNPEYLLREDAEPPADVEVKLPQLRIKRRSQVREFAVRALGIVDPEGLRAITKILDQAIQR